MRVALGGAATGVFSNSTQLWNELYKAGTYTGDRVWRFPLWKYYTEQVTGNYFIFEFNAIVPFLMYFRLFFNSLNRFSGC